MPSNASTIIYADFAELRQSPFLAQLYSCAPKPQMDADYAQFLRDTGVDYERALVRIAIAPSKSAQNTGYFAIADGRFDRKKIVVYASQYGTHEKGAGHEIFSVPVAAPIASSGTANPNAGGNPSGAEKTTTNQQRVSLTFLSNTRIAVATGTNLATLLSAPASGQDAKDWRERFDRLAGSPIFAVIR